MSPCNQVRILCAWLIVWLLSGPCAGQVALIQHAPTLNGRVEGSIQQMTAENTTLNGGATVTGSLLVPGTPAIRLNGQPAYGGTLDGSGESEAGAYSITLNGSAGLGHVVRRTNPMPLSPVAAPPQPAGTRSVTLSSANQFAGDFATLKDLTLNGGVGEVAIPAGTYGNFTANSGGGFRLGAAGDATPAIYNFQNLALDGGSTLQVVGPVVVTLANQPSSNAPMGNAAHPEWLSLRIAAGGLAIAGGRLVYASLEAPGGTVTLSGGSQLVGAVVSDRLVVGGNAVLRLVGSRTENQPPAIALTAPLSGTSFRAPAGFMVTATASDADGTVARVEFFAGNTKAGEDLAAPYEFPVANLAAGVYTYRARAVDNLGAATDSESATVTVTSPNQSPIVTLTSPADGGLFRAPATLALGATAADQDGSIQKVEFYQAAAKLGEDFASPYELSAAGLAPGTYQFSARAYDNLNAVGISPSVTVTVVAPNLSPTVAITAPANGAGFQAPASFDLLAAASDPDGAITGVEFFSGSNRLGVDALAPYGYPVRGLGAGTYQFIARAVDDAGSATDSASITVTVASMNRVPVVSLTAPADGSIYTEPASVDLAAIASDSDGTVAKVEFFGQAARIGEVLGAPYQLHWSGVAAGSYSLNARATDNLGAMAESAPVSITVQPAPATLPFIVEFEASEGFLPGALDGQRGWQASPGAMVVAVAAPGSAQEVAVAGSLPPVRFSHDISSAGATPVFVDFFAQPVAGATAGDSVIFKTSGARIALVGSEPVAAVQVFDGLASSWLQTTARLPIGSGSRAIAWVRFTVREDYAARRWDLYVDGRMVVAEVPFHTASAQELSSFGAVGHSATSMAFDDLYAGEANPIAADSDRDGMDDAWESAHGLDVARNDRLGDLDGDGLSNIAEFVLGTDPNRTDSDGDGLPDKVEVQAGTNPMADDAANDLDQDGVSNLTEFLQGRSLTKGAVEDTGGAVNLRVFRPENP